MRVIKIEEWELKLILGNFDKKLSSITVSINKEIKGIKKELKEHINNFNAHKV